MKKTRWPSNRWRRINEAVFSSGGFLVLHQVNSRSGLPITVVSAPFLWTCRGKMMV